LAVPTLVLRTQLLGLPLSPLELLPRPSAAHIGTANHGEPEHANRAYDDAEKEQPTASATDRDAEDRETHAAEVGENTDQADDESSQQQENSEDNHDFLRPL
jgi:hypothetical protein